MHKDFAVAELVVDSEGGYTYTGIHECVHYVAEVNREGYASIEKFVENYYKKKGVDIEAEKKATQELYEQRGVKLTPEEAMEEIVCNTLSDIATDTDALTAFMGLDSKSRNKFIDALKTLARKLKAWAKTHLAGTKYHDVVIKDADTLLSLAKQLNAELAKASQKNNTITISNDVKYSIKNTIALTLKEQLNLFYNNKLKSSDALYFGTTPTVLEKAGLSKLPLAFGQKDYKKSTNIKHNIPRRVLKNLNNSLSEPILSFGYGNRIGVLTSDIDADGKPVLVAIEKNVMMDREPTNVIRSIYGLDSPKEWLENQIEANKDFVFYNEKRANSFLQTYGYKASVEEGIRLLDERISQDGQNVNKKSYSFADFVESKLDVKGKKANREYMRAVRKGDVKTQERLVYEAAEREFSESKMRDKSGNLETLYHGTQAFGFTEFDLEKMDDKRSIFLTNSKRIASTYSGIEGERAISTASNENSDKAGNYKVVANAKNPLIIDGDGSLWKSITPKGNLEYTTKDTALVEKDGRYVLLDRNTGEFIPNTERAVDSKTQNMSEDELHRTMVEDINRIRYRIKELKTTRAISRYAQIMGYDGVIFRNIADNGGQNSSVAFDEIADIFIVFDSSQVKSVDAVTYDKNGEVIPLSQRFDSTMGDMRYSFSDENVRKSMPKVERLYYEALENEDMDSADMLVNMVASRAMKDSKIRNEVGLLEKVYHGTEAESFNEFDKQRRGQTDSSMYGRGYYFAFDPDYASDFGDNIREFYLDIKNPYYIDINAPASNIADFLISNGVEVNFDYSNMISHYFAKNFGSQKFTDTLIDLGYDGVVVRTDEGENFEAVAFHRNQMKLADVVTYDDQGEAIPLAERFNMQTRDVRYSFDEGEINTDYSDLSKLDDKSLKVYNDRGWARELFSSEDWVLYNEHIGYKVPKNSRYVRKTLADGTLVIDFNNKLVLVSGEYGEDKIYGVVTVNSKYADDIDYYKEDIYAYTEAVRPDKNGFGEICRIVTTVQGEKFIRYYEGNDYSYQKGHSGKGHGATLPSNWENSEYTAVERDRENVSSESQSRVPRTVSKVDDKSYSFGEEDLDFGLYISEDSGVSESLKDSGRAVGAMLEKTRGAEVDIFDISRVMKNNLKDFGVKGETISANERILEIINLASADSYVDGDAVMGEIAAVVNGGRNYLEY